MNPDILYALIAFNLIAFFQCVIDKQQAIKQRWRIPEIQLIAPVLIGGLPGLLIGMILFRHKTKKASFQLKLALATLIFAGTVYLLLKR